MGNELLKKAVEVNWPKRYIETSCLAVLIHVCDELRKQGVTYSETRRKMSEWSGDDISPVDFEDLMERMEHYEQSQ